MEKTITNIEISKPIWDSFKDYAKSKGMLLMTCLEKTLENAVNKAYNQTERTKKLKSIEGAIRYKKYPERTMARVNTYLRIKKGTIIRKPCVMCGAIKVDAHHPSYAFPFWILWLCDYHHRWYHHMRNVLNGAYPA